MEPEAGNRAVRDPNFIKNIQGFMENNKVGHIMHDAVKVASDRYKVVLENDAGTSLWIVRIIQGAKWRCDSHPRSVAICLNDQRLGFAHKA